MTGGGGAAIITHNNVGDTLTELPTLMKQWMIVQEAAAEMNAELKAKRKQSKALKEVILRIMATHKVAALNVSKGTVLHKVSEKAETMTTTYLMKQCKDFFEGDEERAKALVEYLESHRTTMVRHDLKLQTPKGGSDNDSLSHRS